MGVHPWDAAAAVDWEEVEFFLCDRRVVAVGECGIDRLRGPELPVQEAVFRRQVGLSERYGKPLILHAVRSMEDVLRVRREMCAGQLWIWHGYRGGAEQARQLVRAGIAVSVGAGYDGRLSDAVPPEMLFMESDNGVR